jgi:hypothetical protein
LSETTQSSPIERSLTKSGYRDFALIVLLLSVIRAALPFIPVPIVIAPFVDFLLLVGVFIATVYAIYRAMSEKPDPKLAFVILLIGIFVQIAAVNTINLVFHAKGLGAVLLSPIAQTGLMIWCIGLGAVISSILRDKNILIPVAIFLVGFDIFLVLTPLGFTQRIMEQNPTLLSNVAMSIPKSTSVAQQVQTATVAKAGLVGPADLVFLGAFFLAMFKFNMRPKETLKVMIPTLIGYMVVVLVTGWALPALVPIGLVTLIVNRKEFSLNKDEKASTVVVAVLVAAVLVYSATKKPKPRPAPLPTAPSAELQGSANLPAKAQPGLRQSATPSAPQNTPNPP